MTPTPRQIGMKLKRVREEKGLSQDALAKKARLTREYVNKLEAGRHDATVGAVAMSCQPSSFRNTICPVATSPKRSARTAASLGRLPWVFTRRRNSKFSRSSPLVLRRLFHWLRG